MCQQNDSLADGCASRDERFDRPVLDGERCEAGRVAAACDESVTPCVRRAWARPALFCAVCSCSFAAITCEGQTAFDTVWRWTGLDFGATVLTVDCVADCWACAVLSSAAFCSDNAARVLLSIDQPLIVKRTSLS